MASSNDFGFLGVLILMPFKILTPWLEDVHLLFAVFFLSVTFMII